MKTTIAKKAMQEFKSEYLGMMREIERRRAAYRAMREQFKAEQEQILDTMFRKVDELADKLGRFPTAAEITAAMGGDMTRHEVVGNLTVALCEHYNGASSHPTQKARTKAVQSRKGQMKAEYKQVTRRFVEVDESGKVVEDGAVIQQTQTVKTYGFRR